MRFPPLPVEAWPSGVAAFGVEGARAALLAQRDAEIAWVQAARRARAAEAIETLLRVRRTLAHDVRSPLGVVLGHGQMLEEGLVQVDELRASGRALVRQAQRLTQMTEEAAQLVTRAASPVLGVQAVDLAKAWSDGSWTVQGRPRGWVRPGALAELVDVLREAVAPTAKVRLTFTVGVRPSMVVGTFVSDTPFDGDVLATTGRTLAALRGALAFVGAATLRMKLPGDDGRLAVKLVGDDEALAVELRAAGLRITDPDGWADVALVLPGATPMADGVRRLYVGAGMPAPCVPQGFPTDTLVRVLRRVADAPRAVCPVTCTSLVPTPGAIAALQVVGRSSLVREECTAFVAEALEAESIGQTVFAGDDGLRVVGIGTATLSSWFESSLQRRLAEAFPACVAHVLTL